MRAFWLVVGWGLVTGAAADPAVPPAPDNPVADQAWSAIGIDAKALTDAETAKDVTAIKTAVTQVRSDVGSFVQQFPNDQHAAGARMMRAQGDQMALALDLPDAPPKDQVTKEFHELATDATVPAALRVQASMVDASQLFTSAMDGAKDNPHDPAIWDGLDARINEFEKTAGDGPGQEPEQAVVMLRHNQVMLLDRAGETGRLQELLARLAQSPQPELVSMAGTAQARLATNAELKRKPLDLKFTALDGSQIDLARLRGKVVLLDFWATWCPPCVAETPAIVDLYRKFHAQGFEVVGISLDQDKEAMEHYISAHHMPWPQYFDGKGWDNAFAKRFGLDDLPTTWLIGKDGMVVTQEPGDDLGGEIGRLLGTP